MGTKETLLVYRNIIFELVVPLQPWCDPLFETQSVAAGIIKWKRPKSKLQQELLNGSGLKVVPTLNSHAATCKVCARSCCRLRWGVHTQQHQCTNSEESCGSDAGFEHITGNVFESDQGKSPGHGRHTLKWCCQGGWFHSDLHRRRQSRIKNYISIG